MSAPLLQARELRYAYDGVREVLCGVSAAVEAGEFLGIVGPNGAGKSTLLRVFLGLLTPRGGEVRLGGDLVHGLSRREVARRAAFLPQGAATEFGFTVKEIVAMGRHPHLGRFRPESAEDQRVVDACMQRAEVLKMAERRVTELSGGERQRVFLARALAQTAPLLVLDEPIANLDLLHAFQLLETVREQVARGSGAVAALHDLGLAARCCDRLLVLQAGRVEATGTPAEVLTPALLARVFGVEAEVVTGARGLSVHVLGPA